MCNDGVLMSDAKGKANTLYQLYGSVFNKEEGDIPSKGVSTHHVMGNLKAISCKTLVQTQMEYVNCIGDPS